MDFCIIGVYHIVGTVLGTPEAEKIKNEAVGKQVLSSVSAGQMIVKIVNDEFPCLHQYVVYAT